MQGSPKKHCLDNNKFMLLVTCCYGPAIIMTVMYILCRWIAILICDIGWCIAWILIIRATTNYMIVHDDTFVICRLKKETTYQYSDILYVEQQRSWGVVTSPISQYIVYLKNGKSFRIANKDISHNMFFLEKAARHKVQIRNAWNNGLNRK